MLYEVVPDANISELNVKVVVWSNVKALENDYSKDNFSTIFKSIKKNFKPDIIFLDNNIDFDTQISTNETNRGGIKHMIYCNPDYDFRISDSNAQGRWIREGAYYRSDEAEPLSIRFVDSVVSPNSDAKSIETTRAELLKEIHNQEPRVVWDGPQGTRIAPDRPGDHTIIIVPSGESVPTEQSGVFYKSFKHPEKGIIRIEGRELTIDIESKTVVEKQSNSPAQTYSRVV